VADAAAMDKVRNLVKVETAVPHKAEMMTVQQ
jgi:hypothetical protein